MASLDSVLNWVIPTAVVIVFAGILYVKLKEPIDTIFRLVGKIFRLGKDQIEEGEYQKVYRYE